MPALPTPPQSEWSNNVYVIATTRIFVMIGMAYLAKSLYNLVPSIWGTRSASIAAVVSDAIGLEDVISDAPVTVPSAVDASSDLEANLTFEVRPPQSSYDPQDHAEVAQAYAGVQDQGTEVPGFTTAAHGMQEQDIGVRNGDPYIEEGVDTAIGVAG